MLNLGNYGAESLYAGGWRSTDRAGLMEEYGLTGEDADKICMALDDIDAAQNKEEQ